MSTYRVYWPCCDGVTETEAYEPEHCPFCHETPLEKAAPNLLEALQSIAECCDEHYAARDYASRQTEIRGIARAAIVKATGEDK